MDTRYLHKRGTRWWVRKRIPADCTHALGNWCERSTQTGDLRAARRQRDIVLGDLERDCAIVRDSSAYRPNDPRWIVAEIRTLIAQSTGHALEWVTEFGVDRLVDQYESASGTPRADMGTEEVRMIRLASAVAAGHSQNLLADSLEDYLAEQEGHLRNQTIKDKRSRLEALMDWLGPCTPSSVTRTRAGQYVTEVVMRGTGAVATRRNHISTLGTFFKWLRVRGQIDSNPFESMTALVKGTTRGTGPKRDSWSPSMLVTMLTDLEGDLWTLAALGLFTGMRLEEICSIEVSDVHATHIHIPASKSAAGVRDVPIHSLIAPMITRLCKESADGYLLPGLVPSGADRKRGKRIGNRFSKWKLGAIGADPRVCFHSLRNTFITALEESGAAPTTVPLIVGHARVGMTFGAYSAGVSLDKKLEAVQRVTYGPEVDALIQHRNTAP